MANPIVVNKVLYTGKDFDTYRSELLDYVQSVMSPEEFNNFRESELGIMLLELFAYGLSILSFYLDRQATETYLSTAILPSNIVRLARQLGFKVRGAIPAHGTVKIKLNTDLDERLILPAGTQLTGAGLVFETVEAVAWDPHDTSQGIMTDHEARKRKVGGEVICEIW
jgi:hypothetical protein